MPLYEVTHNCPLSQKQQAGLASALAAIHLKWFHVPASFVNVRFCDCSKEVVYMGGGVVSFPLAKTLNMLRAYVRPGHDNSELDGVCQDITTAWKEIVGSEGQWELHAALMLGCISAAMEYGLHAPGVADGKQWMRDHMGDFRKRAAGGDVAFQVLVESMEAGGDAVGRKGEERVHQ
ncbi:hypothetical protein B0A55_04881 [Friedmanniomyces simplex]|uniref:Tautomerase cis-CaaD-like domain-containing protein n=1 Tax=Friedmanniomyces simplex TaxID=329884 RepID=A0A4U0XEZ1_9PEZI|nr:hypothetical protein B0A55_04881 [Friedmanniomyces simplex]